MAWPTSSTEELPWDISSFEGYGTGADRRRILPTYEAAIPPSIANADPQLRGETLVLAEQAALALSSFDKEFGPDAAPLAALLLRSESVASSNVENLTASAWNIATAELGGRTGDNARLIVSNVRAMESAVALSERINEAAILQMHRTLLEDSRPDIAGVWREEPVWIGGTRLSPHGADYVAPEYSRVPAAITDLLVFANRYDLPALAKIAITHAQFENIHPFPDGNGRVGRALLSAMVRHEGLTESVTVPISSGILANSANYYEALTAYRAGNIDAIVALTARAATFAVGNARDLVLEIRGHREEWRGQAGGRRGSAIALLGDVLVAQPVVTADTVMRDTGSSQAAAYRAIQGYENAGILAPMPKINGVKAWFAPNMIAASEGFAARAGRRT